MLWVDGWARKVRRQELLALGRRLHMLSFLHHHKIQVSFQEFLEYVVAFKDPLED